MTGRKRRYQEFLVTLQAVTKTNVIQRAARLGQKQSNVSK